MATVFSSRFRHRHDACTNFVNSAGSVATAMRHSEMFRMTPAMPNRSSKVWFHRPVAHKTEHHGKKEVVPILGDVLEALTPFLFGDPQEICCCGTKGTPWNKDAYPSGEATQAVGEYV